MEKNIGWKWLMKTALVYSAGLTILFGGLIFCLLFWLADISGISYMQVDYMAKIVAIIAPCLALFLFICLCVVIAKLFEVSEELSRLLKVVETIISENPTTEAITKPGDTIGNAARTLLAIVRDSRNKAADLERLQGEHDRIRELVSEVVGGKGTLEDRVATLVKEYRGLRELSAAVVAQIVRAGTPVGDVCQNIPRSLEKLVREHLDRKTRMTCIIDIIAKLATQMMNMATFLWKNGKNETTHLTAAESRGWRRGLGCQVLWAQVETGIPVNKIIDSYEDPRFLFDLVLAAKKRELLTPDSELFVKVTSKDASAAADRMPDDDESSASTPATAPVSP